MIKKSQSCRFCPSLIQSVAIKISNSFDCVESIFALSFEIGEKWVRRVFKSLSFGKSVDWFIPLPVIKQLSTPRFLAQREILSYKYWAVSAKAVKIITFLFSPFSGFLIFDSMVCFRVWSFLSLLLSTWIEYSNNSSSFSISFWISCFHLILSISFIKTDLRTCR